MKVLLIEDDIKTSAFVKRGLEEHGHVVDTAARACSGRLESKDSQGPVYERVYLH